MRGRKRKFSKKQELQICNEYFSKEKLSIIILGKKWECHYTTIVNILKRNGHILRPISESIAGEKHPNFGKNLSEETKKKIGDKNRNNSSCAWHKGLTKETDIRVKKISDANKNRIFSKEHKRKISESRLKRKKTLGFINSEETKQKIREKIILHYQNNLGPYKDTKPELKMKEILKELNIPFEHQFRLGNHLYDFHIPNTNILIEVDGDYWHGNPKVYSKLNETQQKQKQRDKKHNKIAKINNFILLRFWESNILRNTEKVKSKLCSLEIVR